MNAPIDDQLKAEAGRSLVERLREKTNLVKFFRYNAQAKHGVPDADAGSVATSSTSTTNNTTTTNTNTSQPQTTPVPPVVVNNQKDGSGDKMKGALTALGSVAALGAALWGGTKLAGNKEEPAPPPNTQVVQPYESPYQFLEDIGEHLP